MFENKKMEDNVFPKFLYVFFVLSIFSICERVTPRLSHANAAVVLSAVKVR